MAKQEETLLNNAREKRLWYMRSRNDHHVLVQNMMDELSHENPYFPHRLLNVKDEEFCEKIDHEIKLYNEKCKPLIIQSLPVPRPIRDECNRLLREQMQHTRRRITASMFSSEIGDATWNLLNETKACDTDYYRGLDCNRDTEEELENILRLYPEFVANCSYPKLFRCESMRTLAFIPKVVQLRLEYNDDKQWKEYDKRGGLLELDPETLCTCLDYLVGMPDNMNHADERERHAFGTLAVQVMDRLREMGIFKRKDIHEKALFAKICGQQYFAEHQFQFLANWDPDSLLSSDRDGWTSLHHACYAGTSPMIQAVIKTVICFFPRKRGVCLLFQENGDLFLYDTPFQYACGSLGREKTIEIIENTVNGYANNSWGTADALILAATDERIHLDGVYFLLRRDPMALLCMLQS